MVAATTTAAAVADDPLVFKRKNGCLSASVFMLNKPYGLLAAATAVVVTATAGVSAPAAAAAEYEY